MSTWLGVDLGTTWTAAALRRDTAPAEPVALGADGPALPSVVALVGGDVVAGPSAVRHAATDPAAGAREFKRRLGDTTPLVVGGTPFGAETLMGHLLAHVVATVRDQGATPDTVTLTHPAAWGDYKLDLLREAGRVAGLAEVALVSEPEAAARHYAGLGRIGTGDTVAVYDFGGGTFDAAVVRLTDAGTEIVGQPEGLERLGGIDLDQAVVALVDAAVDGALGGLDRSDPAVRQALLALRDECTRAKEALSADTETSVAVLVPGLDTRVRITRVELESAVRPRLEETIGSLERVVASAGVGLGDLAGVLLVGGSSRMPVVSELVASRTGRPVLHDADPKLAVCLGAAGPQHRSQEDPTMAATTPPPPPPPGAGAAEAGEKAAPAGAPPAGADAAGGAETGAPATGPARVPGAGAPARRTEPGARPKPSSGGGAGGKVAAGLAAAGVAAASYIWRDDVADAVFGDRDATATDAAVAAMKTLDDVEAAAAPAAPTGPPTAPDSMDAFDAPGPGPARGGGGGGGPRGGGGGGGGGGPRDPGGADAGPRMARGPQDPGGPTGTMAPAVDPAFEAARDRIAANLESWTPPSGADPQEAAALKAHLAEMIDRFQPRPGQSVDDAVAELRDDFEVRVQNFTQDVRLDQIQEQQERDDLVDQIGDAVGDDQPMAGMPPGGAPAGTDPGDQATRDDLIDQIRDAVDGDPLDDATTRDDLIDQIRDAVDGDGPDAGATASSMADDAATGGLYDPFDEMAGTSDAVAVDDLAGRGIVPPQFETSDADATAAPAGADAASPTPDPWDDDVLGTGAVADAVSSTPAGADDGWADDDLGVLTAPAPADGPPPFEADPLGLPAPDQPVVPAGHDGLDLDDDLVTAPAMDHDDLTPGPDLDQDQDDDTDFGAPDADLDGPDDLSLPPDPSDDPFNP